MSHRSGVWKFFTISATDNSRANCTICNTSYSRGKERAGASSMNTSNMRDHLKRKHPSQYQALVSSETQAQEANAKKPAQEQPSLAAFVEKSRPWPFDCPQSLRLHRKLAEMIALDDQPFNIVNNDGFRRLMQAAEPRYTLPSDKHVREVLLPDIYTAVKAKINERLGEAEFVSVTTDTWTTPMSTESLISFTAHWLDKQWDRRSAVLHCTRMSGSHTASNIATTILALIDNWQLTDRIHVILRDNAKNMTKGMQEAGLPSMGCVAHTLQLSVKRGLASQRSLDTALALCRKIATHFSHSTLAKEKLREIQQTLQLPEHVIIQDVQTRWNSTFYMAERMLEQKLALVNYAAGNDIAELSKSHWTLLESAVNVLRPLESVTRSVSSEESTMGDVIPLVLALKTKLQGLDDSGVAGMKAELLDDIATRFSTIEHSQLHVVSMMLDPRYRAKLIKPEAVTAAKQQLMDAASAIPTAVCTEDNEAAQPPAKRQRTDEQEDDDPLSCLNDLLAADQLSASQPANLDEEIAAYLDLPTIPRTSSARVWWRENESRFPVLARVARRYLAAPCTSVASERLFSSAGQVYTDQRSRLAADKAEMIVFVKHNLRAINFDY